MATACTARRANFSFNTPLARTAAFALVSLTLLATFTAPVQSAAAANFGLSGRLLQQLQPWTGWGLLPLSLQEGAGTDAAAVVDLSHDVGPDTVYWPGFPGFNLSHLVKQTTPAGFWLEANWVSTSEHGGTHVDAPAHFQQGAKHLQQLPVDRFIGPGVVVDVSGQAALDADYRLTPGDLQTWEGQHGVIPQQAVVLVNFGWSFRYPDRNRFFNTRTPDDPTTFHFPGVGLQALQWLVNNRNVKMMGVDVPSIDYAQGRYFEGHRFLCSNGIPFVESLANLDQLPARGMTVFAVPLKLVGGSGFPVRAFALLNNSAGTLRAGDIWWSLLTVVCFCWSLVDFVM